MTVAKLMHAGIAHTDANAAAKEIGKAKQEGVDAEPYPREGDPADAILDVAEESNADLIVVGNKGMHRRILGSVPNTVAHKAPCSVLVVKTT